MQELFIEIFSEEIPANFQQNAAKQFELLLSKAFTSLEIEDLNYKVDCSMHRLSACIGNLPDTLKAKVEEIRGPRTSAPTQAIDGFMRKYNVNIDQLEKRGEFYFYNIHTPSQKLEDIIAELLENVLKNFTWPKSMHWGQSESVAWVRPIRSIICLLNEQIVNLEFCNIKSGDTTYYQRKSSNALAITVKNYSDYCKKLQNVGVIVDYNARKRFIVEQAQKIALSHKLKLKDDQVLIDEVCGLTQQPQVMFGQISEKFMKLPDEVLVSSIRTNQKYLLLQDDLGKLAPYFIIVADGDYSDDSNVIKGNEKVLNARLSDAKFFWDNDLAAPLSSRVDDLKNQIYHSKIGSIYDKLMRMHKIGSNIAQIFDADKEQVTQAINLCKCDLVTQVVYEFPELQGIMGYYYSKDEGVNDDVALAIRDHYKPQGPSDSLPCNKIGAVVALADKIDTLQALFNIDIKPTGNKDPFAQRRAAIGILRILEGYNMQDHLDEIVSSPEVVKFIKARK